MPKRVISSCKNRHLMDMAREIADLWGTQPDQDFHFDYENRSSTESAAFQAIKALLEKDALKKEVLENIQEALIYEDKKGNNYIEWKPYKDSREFRIAINGHARR
ncbi:hypothetical protein LCGC14_1306960 [marine sediment metagenome]|uniref:Uncharacterized protein n=1 Tax=marine sediment metagenome TaxID=412755 RepID=A0A0F9KNG2_9ZZZZ